MKTQYAGPERSAGDRMKVVLLQIYDIVDRDNLQIYEVEALLQSETDEVLRSANREWAVSTRAAAAKTRTRGKKRPAYRCPECEEQRCGNDLHTVTRYGGPEHTLGISLNVVRYQIEDLVKIDGLAGAQIKALLAALLRTHVEEIDLAQPSP